MAKLYWIAGHSAVGKETMLKRFERDAALQRQFAIPADFVTADLNLSQIAQALDMHQAVLVKWQCREKKWVTDLVTARPADQHVVIHLHRPAALHEAAFRRKWPKEPERSFAIHNEANKRAVEAYRCVEGVTFLDVVAIGDLYLVI